MSKFTKEQIESFHKENQLKYIGKKTNKGIVEDVKYLTFVGAAGGRYDNRPQIGERGLIVCVIGTHSYPVGELDFSFT